MYGPTGFQQWQKDQEEESKLFSVLIKIIISHKLFNLLNAVSYESILQVHCVEQIFDLSAGIPRRVKFYENFYWNICQKSPRANGYGPVDRNPL